MMGLNHGFLSLEIETLSPEKTNSWKDILQLGKGRRHDLLGLETTLFWARDDLILGSGLHQFMNVF